MGGSDRWICTWFTCSFIDVLIIQLLIFSILSAKSHSISSSLNRFSDSQNCVFYSKKYLTYLCIVIENANIQY